MDAPRQDRLWITDPRRATCLATVTAVDGDWFALDRALFAPRSRACRHPQYADEGTVWWDGEKRRLDGVREQGGLVWTRLRGTVPDVGVRLQCQLDQDVRDEAGRAHTAMHLLITALQECGAPPMVADPEVRGGGHVRITLAWPPGDAVLDAALRQAVAWVLADVPLQRAFGVKADVGRFLTPQDFQPPDPVPGPELVPVVRVPDVCAHPCDGTHVDRTGRIRAIERVHAAQGAEGFVLVFRVRG